MKKNKEAGKKVAVVSDVVMTYGGAEKVLEVFLEIFPESDLYTLFLTPKARRNIEKKFPQVKINTSFFQVFVRSDSVNKYISLIKFISWIYWEFLDLKKYDLIISSSHSYMSKNVKKGKRGFHISYIHTPPRFLYNEYCEINFIKGFPVKFLIWPFIKILRKVDLVGSKRADLLLANSENVKKRIEKYYKRESQILYPPVDLVGQKCSSFKKNYYVCLSRLVKQKGIDVAVKTCSRYNLPLWVVGDGGEFNYLKKISGKSINFLRQCGDRQKKQILAGAKALIYTSIDEDFGIVPVEALALGVPVIAHNSGGVKETIVDGVNGVFFDDLSESSLKKAIDRFNRLKIIKKKCIDSADKFSNVNFKKRFWALLNESEFLKKG